MQPELREELLKVNMGILGEEASIPDLLGNLTMQNDLTFHLDENDEIFEGYGTRKTAYPYRQQNQYTREVECQEIPTYVLENDYLIATFLPTLGGRLWSLIDKKQGRNLLYTNDVIRFSNLATRNAWFSGGVEWNIGMIGHTPFTTEPLFTATIEKEGAIPVLRMYEFERVRGVEYQMDFWLEKDEPFLNCRMRVTNTDQKVKPMYWWSNMAVPEYENGQVVAPANQAYSPKPGGVYKVDVHNDAGVDVVHYKNIPDQTDYFFDIPIDKPKFIANIDETGYGLFHLSTNRLKSRKLFSWGKNSGSNRWQEFLTNQAGRYVEIQAGLGKTQYGCIPMPGHTAWEWMEQYGAVQVANTEENSRIEEELTILASKRQPTLEEKLRATVQLAKTKAISQRKGSGYGAFKKEIRFDSYQEKMIGHLDFGNLPEELENWKEFLKTEKLSEHEVEQRPDHFLWNEDCIKKIKHSIEGTNRNNWYAFYELGIYEIYQNHLKRAENYLEKSYNIKQNPWALHGLAVTKCLGDDEEIEQECSDRNISEMVHFLELGLQWKNQDLSYVKDAFKMFLNKKCYQQLIDQYQKLKPEMQKESRLYFDYILALHGIGENEKAYHLLCDDPSYELSDVREGDDCLGETWVDINQALGNDTTKIPARFFYGKF